MQLLHTEPFECTRQHAPIAGTHQSHRSGLCQPLPALGTPWHAVDPSARHHGAVRLATPEVSVEPESVSNIYSQSCSTTVT